MSLKSKLIVFLLGFLATSALLGIGAIYIFRALDANISTLSMELNRHRHFVELRASLRDFLGSVRGWALTGQGQYRRLYRQSVADVYKHFGRIQQVYGESEEIRSMGEEFQGLKVLADKVIALEHPVGRAEVLAALGMLESRKDVLFATLDTLYENSLNAAMSTLAVGERIRRSSMVYIFVLVSFAFITFAFLALFMRRMLSGPFEELLRATEQVARGELGYRIATTKKDEFGLIARRFDSMVEALAESTRQVESKLRETELMLDVAKIAGTVLELREALELTAQTIAQKLRLDAVAVYLLRPEQRAFFLEAISQEDMPAEERLPIDAPLASMVLETLKPVLIEDTREMAQAERMCLACRSLLAVPLLRDNLCKGLLVMGRKEPYGIEPSMKDTAMILAHTIAVVVRNAELYSTTKRQLQQLGIMYDLSKALASVYEPQELLESISREIARLTGAKVCIIRLLEADGRLHIKSSWGLETERAEELSLAVGEGVAGWVVKEGKSLFVEDVSKLPEHMRTKTIRARSAICVPLRVGERIIGTLGIYDKTAQDGTPTPFDLEDLQMAEGFASLSAVAIDRARMQEQERKARLQVEEAKRRLDLLFETVQGGIVSMDADYRILSANRYVERWMDRPLEEVLGRDAREVFHHEGGICPHCAARATFQSGDINSITQSRGLNYAELTAYPVKDPQGRVVEVVVFIQDITDRVLYQEEIMSLYKEVAQTKEYLESLIANSADAIVTTDLEGRVTSWNPAAEKIYGFSEEEVLHKPLPFIPDFLREQEAEFMERLRKGDVIKDIETLRLTKDGRLIEVSLTLSPIKDAAGEVIGTSGISRDITEKKRTERELIRRNQELSRLFFISSAMRGTLELERLLRMILTAVTMSDGLGFNRAILFLVDEQREVLKGAMGVGPSSPEEAWRIWEGLSLQRRSLHDIMEEIERGPLKKDSFFDRLTMALEIPLEGDTALVRAVREKVPFNVEDASSALADPLLLQQLGTQAYAVVPLVSRDKVIGVLWVDNLFNRKPITEEDMRFLSAFSNQVASAIENARLFEQVRLAEAELENIFRSISDMVYLTDSNYTIKKVNQAVLKKVGLPEDEVVGKKCYQVFHGMEEPLQSCPHMRTMQSRRPNIEEYDDPYLKGTFLSSTSPLFDAEGNFLGVVHVVRDITEMKQLRERLQAAERMAALGEVAAKVAHEIRNPLVSVGGFAKRLEKKLDGNLREYASIIVREVSRLEQILKEILGFVRHVRLQRRRTNLQELLEEVLKLLEAELRAKENTIERNIQPLEVFVDADRMKEALFNIISNANQATDGGTITITTYAQDGKAVVEVSDTGCGIKKEDLPRIFDPFFTTRPMGTGLGLAITRRIIQEHEGEIQVSSRWPGGGSTFRIILPIRKEV